MIDDHERTADRPSAIQPTSTVQLRRRKLIALAALVIAVLALTWHYGHWLDLEYLALRESQIKQYQQQHPLSVIIVALLIYVAVVGLSLPGSLILTLAYGWFFGFVQGTVLANVGATMGAIVAFFVCRFLLRDSIEARFGRKLVKFNESLRRDGPYFLLAVRMIPIPFFMVNALLALTNVSTRTFWWTSQLGMLPATFIFVYAASRVPNAQVLADQGINAVFTPRQVAEMMFALALVGSLPLITRLLLRRISRE